MTAKKTFISLLIAAVFLLSALCVLGVVFQSDAYAETNTVDIYAINDFHGEVNNMPQIAGFLAARKKEGAIILSSGDMFQGSMESNSNYGKLLTDCMEVAGFDAMTLGNHEFDWGIDNLKNLSENSGIPFLGANIYHWGRNEGWGDFADDLADRYIIKELDNGLKVGIIGVMGDGQISSISSQYVQTIGFKEPLDIIKQLAKELRNEKDCDVVVVSAHDGPHDLVNDGLKQAESKEPATTAELDKYVDAVFCAHTHYKQCFPVNGSQKKLPFLQGGSNGENVSYVRLNINNGNVTASSYRNIAYSGLDDIDENVRDEVQSLIDNSNANIEAERNEVIGKTDLVLNSSAAIPRLVCNAIADYVEQMGYTIDLAIVNVARSSLPAGDITYSALYEALPFDNMVYIAKVSGKDLRRSANSSSQSIWRVSGRRIYDSDVDYYMIAVIDYLLYHQSDSRYYNYFPSAFDSGFEPVPLTKKGVNIYNYRLITRDFLLKQNTIQASTYTQTNLHTDKELLNNVADLPIVPYRYGNAVLPWWAIALICLGAVVVVTTVVVVTVVAVKKRKKATATVVDEE